MIINDAGMVRSLGVVWARRDPDVTASVCIKNRPHLGDERTMDQPIPSATPIEPTLIPRYCIPKPFLIVTLLPTSCM